MATKKTTVVAKTTKRRRQMKGAPAKRRSPRRMNGAKDGDFIKDALTGAAGALLAGYAPKLVQKVAKGTTVNPHLVNGMSAVLGYGVFKMAPKMRSLGVGLVIGGVANSAAAIINSIPGMAGAHTGNYRELPTAARKRIQLDVDRAMRNLNGDPATLTGMDPATLTGMEPATLTGTYNNGI